MMNQKILMGMMFKQADLIEDIGSGASKAGNLIAQGARDAKSNISRELNKAYDNVGTELENNAKKSDWGQASNIATLAPAALALPAAYMVGKSVVKAPFSLARNMFDRKGAEAIEGTAAVPATATAPGVAAKPAIPARPYQQGYINRMVGKIPLLGKALTANPGGVLKSIVTRGKA
jgi:hypothetical protein